MPHQIIEIEIRIRSPLTWLLVWLISFKFLKSMWETWKDCLNGFILLNVAWIWHLMNRNYTAPLYAFSMLPPRLGLLLLLDSTMIRRNMVGPRKSMVHFHISKSTPAAKSSSFTYISNYWWLSGSTRSRHFNIELIFSASHSTTFAACINYAWFCRRPRVSPPHKSTPDSFAIFCALQYTSNKFRCPST